MYRVKDDEVSQAEAAAILAVHRLTIRNWCISGFLRCRMRAGIRFPLLESVLAQWKKREQVARLKAANAKVIAALKRSA
jgi:predicted site-specific integrase-resolvase